MIVSSSRLIGRRVKSNFNKNCKEKVTRNFVTKILKSRYEQSIELPEQSLSQFVFANANKWKDLPALTCGVSGRSYTFGQAWTLSNIGAHSLLANTNLRPGDRIGLLLPNIPEFSIIVHASMQAGLVVTFANPLYTVAELTRQFQNGKVRCIVTVPQLLQTARDTAESLKDYDCTINIGGSDDPEKNLESLSKPKKKVNLPTINQTDLAALPYSSGTTGPPKGTMLNHFNLMINIHQLTHPELVELTDPLVQQETSLTVLPFFHIYGFNAAMNYLSRIGTHLVTMPKFVPQDYIKCLEKYQPDLLFVVPSLLLFLITHPEVTSKKLSCIKRIVSGAAPLKKTLIDQFFKKIDRSDCIINQGYGMTEASPGITYTPHTMPSSKNDSCGHLLPSTIARVIDLTNNKDVDTFNQQGELLVKGPQVMKGYLDNPTATRETIDSDGWLHTGDVVYYDEEEYFYIVDRNKELIKVKGHQVSPTELESLLLEIPGVADAAVIGVPDDRAGELPKAFLVLKTGFKNVTVDSVQDYITPKVATYKKLAGGVSFIEAIPRNPSGKILRNELKKMCSRN